MARLESRYREYLTDLSETEIPISREEFLNKLRIDSNFNRSYGKKLTKPLGLDERLQIAYPDKEERIATLIFMGTRNMKILLNKLKIPTRKIVALEKDLKFFLEN